MCRMHGRIGDGGEGEGGEERRRGGVKKHGGGSSGENGEKSCE